jgi:SAM-dependent methyltransferase
MPNKFKHRSDQTELLDAPDIAQELLFRNLDELDMLNSVLGGHFFTLEGIKKLVTNKNNTYHIADLGCGSGDTMRYIANWARANGYKVKLTGVDLNTDAIEYLNKKCADYPEIRGVASDYRDFLEATHGIDIVHCSLFCHHLTDAQLLELFSWFKYKIRTGFVINDLQRNRLAYFSVLIFTRLLNGSMLAKHDGPISVLRGFKLKELRELLQKAALNHYTIKRRLGFRWLVVGWS